MILNNYKIIKIIKLYNSEVSYIASQKSRPMSSCSIIVFITGDVSMMVGFFTYLLLLECIYLRQVSM